MNRKLSLIAYTLLVALGTLPLALLLLAPDYLDLRALIALNLAAWVLVLTQLYSRTELKTQMEIVAREMGVDPGTRTLEQALSAVIWELRRRDKSISTNLIEGKIKSKEELSKTLERIVTLAHKLLQAESAELALFDSENGLYHSSFVLGKPFRSSAQAMLSGAVEGEEEEPSPDVLVQPIAFAGSILGSLRVALKRGELPSTGDHAIIKLLALQGGLAIINSEYTAELVRMKASSEETQRAKTGFLANLSHEIRGPLGIMLNAVELVLDGLCGELNEDQLDTLGMVRSNGEHLLELINDVLDYAKVESGKVVPNPEDLLVNELLKDIGGVVRTQADSKGHKLAVKDNQEVLAIAVDRRHIRQMLINLLTNAIKYTPSGGQIEIWAERTPGNRVRLNVRDNGVGIEESEKHKVFAAFERVDNTYSIEQVGTGLGMPLTKKLAEVNAGTIGFESNPGEGSRFWLQFPAVSYDPTTLKLGAREEPEAKGNGEVILLVEGKEQERTMTSRYLHHIGFKVVTAGSKAEVLDILRKGEVDMAMLDNSVVDRPDENIIADIRQAARSSLLPIILVSSRAFVFDIEKYLKSGIDLCLIKPIALKNLGRVCRQLIDGNYAGDAVLDSEHATIKSAEGSSSRKATPVDDMVH